MTKSAQCLTVIVVVLGASAALFARPARAQSAPECFPACRVGFVCTTAGACVSACNPACPDGQICTAAAECVPAQPVSAVTAVMPVAANGHPGLAPVAPGWPPGVYPAAPPSPPAYAAPAYALPPPTLFDREPPAGWARGGAVFGLLATVGTLVLTALVIDNNAQKTADDARAFGIAATGLTAIATPIVAAAGASARRLPGVRGNVGLRVSGWVGYGVALANAVSMVALSYSTKIDDVQIALGGGLGALATTAFTMDALISASQADSAARALRPPPAVSLAPWVGAARGPSITPTYGVAAGF